MRTRSVLTDSERGRSERGSSEQGRSERGRSARGSSEQGSSARTRSVLTGSVRGSSARTRSVLTGSVRGSSARTRSERGSGTVLVLGVLSVVVLISFAAICISGYLIAARRAEGAADLAALAGAQSVAEGGDACRAARVNAEQNRVDVDVDGCEVAGDDQDFVVVVQTVVEVQAVVPGLPTRVTATSYAGSLQDGVGTR